MRRPFLFKRGPKPPLGRRFGPTFILAILALCLAACDGNGGGTPAIDQGTVDACYATIGVAVPGRDGRLGETNGWRQAGQKAAADAKHPAVRAAGVTVVASLSAAVIEGGFTDQEIARYTAAVLAMEQACKDSNAFKGTPFGKLSPFGTSG